MSSQEEEDFKYKQYNVDQSENLIKNRLYDKGFNQRTMPSVKREKLISISHTSEQIPKQIQVEKQLLEGSQQYQNRPQKLMRAKLNSYSQRQNKLEPIKFQKQSIVLHQNQKSEGGNNKQNLYNSKNQLGQSGMKKTMGTTSQIFMNRQQMQQQLEREEQEAGRETQYSKFPKSSKNAVTNSEFFSPLKGENKNQLVGNRDLLLDSGIDFHSQMHKTSSLFNLPQLQHKPHQLPQLGSTIHSDFNFTQDQFYESVARANPHPFEQKEYKRTKFLVDKISGKFNIEKRYLEKGKNKKLTDIEQEIIEEEENKKQNQNQPEKRTRSTKLDTYIDYILKGVTNIEEYIYLIRANADDPYDLEVSSYDDLKTKEKEEQLKEYYIISRKGLCHYVNGKPIEFIQLAYWLKERETYDQIIALNFFTKFRKWKTLKMWKKNVIKEKTQKYAKDLEEKLFILNPVLRDTLLDFRKDTQNMMENVRFVQLENQEKYARDDNCYTLEVFKDNQEKQRKKINDQIQEFSKNCRKTVQDGFEQSLNQLRKNQYMNSNEDDLDLGGQKKANQNFFRLKESAYENLGFSDNMSYERRSELRKECSKFLRFSYLVDFLAMESLSQIYTLSCQQLEKKLYELTEENTCYVVTDVAQKGGGIHEDPLFQLNLEAQLEQIDESKITVQKIREFKPPPIGDSKDEEFNPLYHIKKKPAPGEEVEPPKPADDEEEVYVDRKIVPQICELWLKMSPDKEAFSRDIIKCITEGRTAIQCFERWSRSDDMTKYVSVLEEWDDHVSQDWQNPDSNYLNPSDWIEQNDSELFSSIYKPLIDGAFEKCDKWIKTQYDTFLLDFWELQQLDIEDFQNFDQFDDSDTSFKQTLKKLTRIKEFYETKLPFQVDLGLFRIETSRLREILLPAPKQILEKLEKLMPSVLKRQMKVVKDWMTEKLSNMKVESLELEDFVSQQETLKVIMNHIGDQKDKLNEIKNIVNILTNQGFEFNKDDLAFFNNNTVVKKLDDTIQKSEEMNQKKSEYFQRTLKQQLVPEFLKEVQELNSKVSQSKYIEGQMNQATAIEELGDYMTKMKELVALGSKYNKYELILEQEPTQFDDIDNLKQDLTNKYDMWLSSRDWNALVNEWMGSQFNDIQNDKIREKVEFYEKIVRRCDKNMPAGIPTLIQLKESVQEFKNQIPIVRSLRNEKMKAVHWNEIQEKVGQKFDVKEPNFTLKTMVDMKLGDFKDEIVDISTQATQEDKLSQELLEVSKKWDDLTMDVTEYQRGEGKGSQIKILCGIDDLNAALDELLASMNNILGSRYLKQLRDKAQDLQWKILNAQDTLGDWINVQKNWMYLENLFSSNEIKSTMKEDSQQFDKVDKFFKDQMHKVEKKGRFISNIIDKQSKKSWEKYNEILNSIQKALDQLLEAKRNIFPRFYFLSNDELLEIIANSAVSEVEKNLKKCFDGINKLDYDGNMVNGIVSPEGERVKLRKNVNTGGIVEGWLSQLEAAMKEAMKYEIKKGKKDYESSGGSQEEKQAWVKSNKAQVVAAVENIIWTMATENAFEDLKEQPDAFDNWATISFPTMLQELIEMVAEGNLKKIELKSVVALITQDVHARDILTDINNADISEASDFSWQKELRYYQDTDDLTVKQVNAVIMYGYEYMGATSRLVITKLTDRCWLTITGALNIQLGAAPAGPAGTGKTESTKDLAKALGQLCIVFNCSDQIEYKMMQRLFSGLCEQGAWACLDEFNRIDIEVLSVVAQQLQTIRAALLRRDDEFEFGDNEKKIKLKAAGYGVFITMNPGYAGRTELPDNLKVLFRPVSMMIPDYGIIAQIMLLAEGFKEAVPLSKKMTQLYKLSSEQLSQQDHYDFGMRAVKSVLNMAGGIKRANKTMAESTVLIRAMKDANVPKFLKQDLPLFSALIQDLFPDTTIPDPDYGKLPIQIRLSITNLNLQQQEPLADKVVQLYETFNVRFGVMLVGDTNSAKTTCYKILQNAQTELWRKNVEGFNEVLTKVLNPKCISMGELYGEVNIYTQEWTDGLASQIMREGAASETSQNLWVVFDGPVDALWIENMNTVLDDNKMLCLANGQRIKLRDEMRMLFEVQDLKVASPATVSRCGMVYLMYEDLGWIPYVKSWLDRVYGPELDRDGTEITPGILDQELRDHVFSLFEKSIDEFLELIRKKLSEPIETVDLQLVISLCNLFESFLQDLPGLNFNEKSEYKKRFINHIFTFSFVWSMGTTVHEEHHPVIDQFVKEKFSSTIFPNPQTVYSYNLDTSDLMFKHWDNEIQQFEYDEKESFFNLLVPTLDTTRYSYILEYLLNKKKHVYVTGASGIGKSVIVSGKLQQIKEPRCIDNFQLIFSAQTSSYITQLAIEGKLNKNSKTLLSAKPGRRNCIFIDDINMPAVEEYGAQAPIELLRLLVDKQGFYDRKERFWKDIKEFILLICSAPPGGGRSNITQRFSRHFNILNLPQPTNEILNKIFESILSGFYEKLKFPEAVRQTAQGMVRGTIEVYKRIMEEKKPIPSKFHYTFNLRDVSKVFMGIMMVSPAKVRDEAVASKLWIHENTRVFHDRLINDEDKDWFYNLLMEIIQREFKTKYEKEQIFQDKKIFFTDIHKLESDSKFYEYVTEADNKKLMVTLDNQLDNYNGDHPTKMNLVFFSDCVEHILRISRILRSPRGSAMLIGVGGSGKQSLTKLSNYMLEYKIKMVEIVKNYNIVNFREFIKEIMRETVGLPEGKGITFLFTDTQIIEEGFLEDINNILNSGEVPNLWPADEKSQIIDEARPLNEQKKREGDPDTIYKTFVEKVRNDLHVVLCMSPVGDSLRVRCRKFPSLVDCCGLDWFSQWPAEALVSVAKSIFIDTPNFPQPQTTSFENLVESLAIMCKEVHTDATEMTVKFEEELKRKVYTTPKSYLDHIKLYIQLLQKAKNKVGDQKDKLANGFSKLQQAKEQIAGLKIQLTELEPILVEKAKQVEVAQKQVNADKIIADEKEEVVQAEADKVSIQKSSIEQIANEAQSELDKVLPELEAAQKAVQNIDKAELTNIKGAASPPAIVVVVFEAVCILFGEKNTDWKTAQRLLGNLTNFVNFLQNYNSDNMDEKTIKRLKKVLANPEFDPKEIAKRVKSAADIASFCVAMDKFADINKVVRPKKIQVEKLNAELKIANDALDVKMAEVKIVKDKVEALNKELQSQVKLKQELDDKKKLTSLQLVRAGKLIDLTADESVRWQKTVEVLQGELENLFGDVFLSVAGISYNGPFTGVYRDELITKWGEKMTENCIPWSEKYDIVKSLGNPMQIREWIIKGLPSDPVSQENSIYTTQGFRWPLLIDPQLQARKWIVNMEYDQYSEVETFFILKFSSNDFIRKMTLALSNGYAVLVQDVDDSLDPALDTVLGKAIYESNDGRKLIKFADKEIDYDDRFRLYMMTKKPNPNYLAEIYIKVTVINFTATFEGLNDQLLALVVGHEQEQVEKDRDENVMKLAEFKRKIEECENQILDLLKKTEADKMLDDDLLIQTLETSKKTSEEISIEIEKSQKDEVRINQIRGDYKPISLRGAILYFVIKDLALIDPMYQYSLQAVTRLFKTALQTATKVEDGNLEQRLINLSDSITKTMYANVCRGLFEAHKLIYSFLISSSINKNSKKLDPALFSLLLKGAGTFDKSQMPANPDKDRITTVSWDLAGYLDSQFEQYKDLTKHMANTQKFKQWQDYIMCADPITKKLPDEWETKLDIFEKMLIIKILRPEKIMFAISNYVLKEMGQYFLEPPTTSINKLYEDSDNQTPIIFVLSQGADPTSQIEAFSKVMNMEQKLKRISLGQGQGPKAEKLIKEGKVEGNWVFLQNCHLDKTFMPQLEVIVNQFEEDAEKGDIHEDFRLFLTSMPAPYFPVAVLQAGIKVTNEPPRGMRANLKRSWLNLDEESLVHETKPEQYQKLVWGLTYFHAIIQERRKFGPLGWNIRYEFNDSDLECSTLVMSNLLKESDEIPWDSLLFISGHINYGGRVTDDWDRRCLITILKNFYSTEILNDTYQFSESQTYIVPKIGTLESYRQYIETLPLQDDPAVFGMHENANITYQQQESNKILEVILSIQPRSAGGTGGKSSDDIILEMIEKILEELPPLLHKEDGLQEMFEENEIGLIPSLSTVLLQEITKFNGLLKIMSQTLTFLRMAIGGQMVMSSELDAVYTSMLNNQVPLKWQRYPSLKPLASWIVDLKERVDFMRLWLLEGNPICYWMSGLFFPQGFLTGVLQTHARKTKVAIDQLYFQFRILLFDKEQCVQKPNDGVYIYGLFMDGALYDRKSSKASIVDSAPGIMYNPMPVIQFIPATIIPETHYRKKENNYECPVYKTSVRAGVLSTTGQSTNFVLAVDVPNEHQTEEYWIQRGAALLCQLDY